MIYRYKAQHEEELFTFLMQQLETLGIGCYWVNQDKRDYSNHRSGVRLVTAKSSLGLEFKVVLIIWTQQFGVGNEAEAKRELYVSMTRAQEKLYLIGPGYFPILNTLKDSEAFDLKGWQLKSLPIQHC